FFRYLSPRVILALSLILIVDLPTHLYDAFKAELPVAEVQFPMAEEADKYYSLVQNGGFLEVLKDNWRSWAAEIEYQLESGILLMDVGDFLLGLYVGRSKLCTSLGENISKFKFWNESTGRAVLVLLSIG